MTKYTPNDDVELLLVFFYRIKNNFILVGRLLIELAIFPSDIFCKISI